MSILDSFKLDGQVAVITGGFGQLGQRFAAALADQGARVALLDIVTEPKKALPELDRFRREGQVKGFKADITKRADLERALTEIVKAFGTPTVLINNAAIDSPPDAPASENGPFETYPEKSLDLMLDVNLKGTFLACQVFGGAMAQAGQGSVINVSSIYGMVSPNQDIYEYKREAGESWYKPATYSLTKSGILNLTRYLATYWAKKGVRVNTLTPAGIFNGQDAKFLDEYTRRMPMGRMARPDELNGAVVFLASNASSYMTGSNLVVDGGWTAW